MKTRWALLAMPLLFNAQPLLADENERRLEKITKKLKGLTAEHFLETISRKGGDDLDTMLTVTTIDGFKHRGGFTDRFRTDSFVRAFVSKETGETRFQIYATITYNYDLRSHNRVNFATPSGPQSADLEQIDRDVDCSYSICSYLETVGFSIDEDLLRKIANGGSDPWRFRFYARSGDDWTELMSRAELAGALAAVDQYRSSLQLK